MNKLGNKYKFGLIVLFIGLFTSCASHPIFDTSQVNNSLTPRAVVGDVNSVMGQVVLWGGTILETRNLERVTQIEVLAYPLNKQQRPMLDKQPVGRFIMQHEGYLEPTSYAQGQHITVLGEIIQIKSGQVGETEYLFPLINDEKIKLWKPGHTSGRTSFQFGIGIRL